MGREEVGKGGGVKGRRCEREWREGMTGSGGKEFRTGTPTIKNWNSHNILHMEGVGVKLKGTQKFLVSGIEKKGYSNFWGKSLERKEDCRPVSFCRPPTLLTSLHSHSHHTPTSSNGSANDLTSK